MRPIPRWSRAALLVLALAARARGQGVPAASAPEPTAPSYYAGEGAVPDAPRVEMPPLDTALDSLLGDVYAEGRWRPLSFRTFFSEGWLEPWAGAPAGRDGRTPRHGWLGAFDGVFYRLWFADFSYNNRINTSFGGNRYAGDYAIFLPFSRRFEVLIDAPFVVANGTADPRRGYASEFGDLTITPRFLLAEGEATTQVFALAVRAPTGSRATAGDIMAITPRYEFWTNPGGPWVVRGAVGAFVPLNKERTPAQAAIVGGLAVGRYFTPHDVPFGDLVFYAACNVFAPLDGAARNATYAGLGPGTRFHIAKNYFFMNYWEFPVTGPHPFAYTAQFALLKVF